MMTPGERFQLLKSKGLCHQCLYPGANQQKGRHKDGKCQRDFVCKHQSHDKYPSKKHVLVCQEHSTSEDNIKILESYRARCIKSKSDIPTFSKEIKLSFHVSSSNCPSKEATSVINSYKAISSNKNNEGIIQDNAVYILQTIKVNDDRFTLFFDTGCSELVSKYESVKRLGDKATQEYKGSISIDGVGNLTTNSNHGVYQIQLPLYNGKYATMSGVCLEQITSCFPTYPLHGQVEDDIKAAFIKSGGDPTSLPRLPPSIGGETDFMIGAKYLRYHPKYVYQLPSGLTIYESIFENADGGRGVIGGPHQVFNAINEFYHANQMTFFSSQYQIYRLGIQVNPDVSLLDVKCPKDYFKDLMYESYKEREDQKHCTSLVTRNQKIFDQVENAGSEITYRCINCRDCKECKHHDNIESISIKEEIEQEIINQSVTVDITIELRTQSFRSYTIQLLS